MLSLNGTITKKVTMKEKRYYIYEVPGVKIGCTSEPEKRMKDQGFTNWLILEEHSDMKTASNRERELQKEKGYKLDQGVYSAAVNNRRIAGIRRKETKTGICGLSLEERKVHSSSNGKKTFENGTGIFKYSKEERKVFLLKAASIGGKKGGANTGNQIRNCPYCSKQLKGMAAYNKHTKYCKLNPKNNT